MIDQVSGNNSASVLFKANGFCVIPGVLSDDERSTVAASLQILSGPTARTRTLLNRPWCIELAELVRRHRLLSGLLPSDPVSVQASYLPKLKAQNWKVGLHRDLFIPVKSRIQSPAWSNWSVKEGIWFVQPPRKVLEELVAVRIHMEANTAENGPLFVVPGSHSGTVEFPRVPCYVPAGGALVIRPRLLHASSKLNTGVRRVVHLLFGPRKLPDGLEWANAV